MAKKKVTKRVTKRQVVPKPPPLKCFLRPDSSDDYGNWDLLVGTTEELARVEVDGICGNIEGVLDLMGIEGAHNGCLVEVSFKLIRPGFDKGTDPKVLAQTQEGLAYLRKALDQYEEDN